MKNLYQNFLCVLIILVFLTELPAQPFPPSDTTIVTASMVLGQRKTGVNSCAGRGICAMLPNDSTHTDMYENAIPIKILMASDSSVTIKIKKSNMSLQEKIFQFENDSFPIQENIEIPQEILDSLIRRAPPEISSNNDSKFEASTSFNNINTNLQKGIPLLQSEDPGATTKFLKGGNYKVKQNEEDFTITFKLKL